MKKTGHLDIAPQSRIAYNAISFGVTRQRRFFYASNCSICITEFGTAYPTFKLSNTGTLIACANCGFDAVLEWSLTNSFLPDPLHFYFDEPICLYRNQTENKKYLNQLQPQRICNEFGPALRYIKKHSRVLGAQYDNLLDIHTAVFEKDGDYTVIVEANGSGNRKLKLDLSERI